MKKVLSIMLALFMVVTMLPMAVLPASAAAVADLSVTIDTGASVTLKDADGDGYYDVGTANDLYAFAAAVNGGNSEINGELTADITVNKNVLTANGALNGNGSNFRVWTPIGGNSYTYNGTFDGGEHTVSGLYFNNSTVNCVGMFGNIHNGGKVMNVGVIDSYFCGSGYVGGVAGSIYDGTVENSYNTGTVTGRTDVGGLVGDLDGTITNSYNAGTVTGTSSNVGGVVGSNGYYFGTITNCYNTGSVSSTGSYVGGVVGNNYNTVTNSYNTGSVSGSAHVGGVVGSNNFNAKNVENCYNIGTVTGTDNFVGAVAGGNFSTVTNCYYLNGCATGANNVKQFGIGNGNAGSTTADVAGATAGKTSIGDICTAVGYHSIDENCVCTICGAVEHNNFDIKGFCTECDAYEPADLNENGYYEIGNAGQLFWFANYINTVDRTANAVLTADIDLEGRRWTPIGSTGENNNNFRGIFDGQNHTIEGLYVEGGRAGLGFFGEVRTGTVKNFTIYGDVVANTEVDYIGGVIGSICGLNGENDLARNGAVIQNITSYVNLTAKKHGIGMIGGFVGYANHESLIENCSWYGTFDAGIYRVDSGAGGFIGKIQENTSEVTIRNCGAYGTIKTNYAKNSYNNTATIYMGGFLSFTNSNAKTTLENCLFAGKFERGANLTDEALLGAFGTVRSVNAIKNCYYLGDDGLEAVHSDSNLKPGSDNVEIKKVTAEQLKSGEIAYKLQGEQTEHVWGQTIGTDNYPILGGEKVYHGYTSCADEVMVYSNDSSVSAANPAHAWGEGVLTRPTKTQEGYYTYTCTACGVATKTEEVERAANYADYTKALEDLRAYLDSDMLTDENKSNISEWLAMYDTDEAYGFIAGEEATVQMYIDATAQYVTDIKTCIQDCLAGNHSGNGDYCEICGAELHVCDFTGEWKYDADKHWKECTDASCDKISEGIAHTGGTATCTTQAVCTTCGAQYGDFSKTNHTFDNTCCGYYGAEGNEQSVWWTLVDGTLTIGGTGAMADKHYTDAPWYNSTKSVTALVIQEGVTHIGDNSFMTCKMESVYIPASVKTIGASAFVNCFNLKDVTFADGSQVTEIGDGSFRNAALEQITIPASVTSIGDLAFDLNHSLTDIFIEEGNTSYKDIDGVLYTTDGTLVLYPINKAATEFTTPDGVTKIAKYAFGNNKNLRTVTLSEGVTTIEESVFFNCESLQTLTIPASVTSIGVGAIEISFQLTDIFVDEDNTSYKDIDGVLYTTDGTLVYYPINKEATEFTTPEGVTKIAAYAFFCNMNLETITLSEGVTTIEEAAFDSCYNLQTLTIPASITAIAEGSLGWYDQTVTVNLPCNWDGSLYTFYEEYATLNYSDHVADETAGQTCKGYKCTVCGAFYGEVAADAHDWSNKDGICANGCGAECTHENQTGSVCEICGAELHVCDFTGEWKYNADKHWKECSCGLASEEGTHTGGTATCTTQAVCETCNTSYGGLLAHDWSDDDGICVNCGISSVLAEIMMLDNGYDGWDSGALLIKDGSGTEIGTATLEDGYDGTYTFRIAENEAFTLTWKDSEKPVECRFNVYLNSKLAFVSRVCGYYADGEVVYTYCIHTIEDGVCTKCGQPCRHLNSADGECIDCGFKGMLVEIKMHDYDEDGWMGNNLLIEDSSGTAIGSATLIDGAEGTYAFLIAENEAFTLTWQNVMFSNNCTFDVAVDGATVFESKTCNNYANGEVVYTYCDHTFENSVCTKCGQACEHLNVAEGKCSDCGFKGMLVEIRMHDKYSDGWTDNALLIKDGSGTTIGTATFTMGSEKTDTFLIAESEVFMLTWQKGAFPEECTFEVAVDGVTVFESTTGDNYADGEVVYTYCDHTFENSVCIKCGTVCAHENQTGSVCEICGKTLHTCDFSGEWKYDADKHWKECTADDCDKISEEADHDFLNGECTVCDYVCDHANATSDLIRPVQNADGTWGQGSIVTTCPDCGNVETESVDRADYTAFDAAVAKLQEILASGNLIDGPKATINTNLNNVIDEVGYNRAVVEQTTVNDGAQRINGYIAMLEAGLADGTMKKADLSYMTALLDEVNALIDSNPNNIVSSEVGNYSGPYSYYRGQINNGNLTQADHDRNMAAYDYENQLETLLAGLKDGTALKADYTEIDEVIAAIDEALKTASVTEDMQAELDSIKKELDAYKANTNVSVAMLANSGLLAKAEAIAETMNKCANGVHVFTKYEVVDKPACEVAGKEVAVCDNGCGATDEKAVDALGHTELPAVKENEVAATCENAGSYDLVVYCDVCKAEVSRTTETVDALGHTELPAVKENEVAADCENAGSYDLVVYCDVCKAEVSRTTETVDALGHTELPAVKENEVAADCENAGSYDLVVYCDVCKAEVSRTTETVEALGHAFTVYTVTAEPTCEEAGKQVSVCDNGCGATDEKEIAALEHSFVDYVSNGDATCTADGTKTAECDNGCGKKDTVADEGSKLDHVDENGDDLCDECGNDTRVSVADCECTCHRDDPLNQFFYKIIQLIRRIFGINSTCECGTVHTSGLTPIWKKVIAEAK